MKKVNMNLFGLGILTALFTGCFSPVTVIPFADSLAYYFTIDLMIGKESKVPMGGTEASGDRTIAGPGLAQIKGAGCNIIQVLVLNTEGELVTFDEVRRTNDSETEAKIKLDFIPFNKTYHFLLLMGHWEHDGDYNYIEDHPPTLLAVGLKEERVIENKKVTVTIWPITVDTKFTSVDSGVPAGMRKKEPVIKDGKPGPVELHKGNWTVNWTINRGNPESAANGFTDLILAQQILGYDSDKLLLKSKKTILRGEGLEDLEEIIYEPETGNVITLDMGTYTSKSDRKEKTGSAAFSLEYIPFNLRGSEDANPWKAFNDKSVFDLTGAREPVWIIRNGINDLPQDSLTNFNTLGDGTSNGNGAISFNILKTADVQVVVPW